MEGPEITMGDLLTESKLSVETRMIFLFVLLRSPSSAGRSFERKNLCDRVEGRRV